jgi:type IV pilus assembly protein PilC
MAQAVAKASMFVWEGTDKRGKKVKGEMSGQNDALVKATLRRFSVRPGRRSRPRTSPFSAGRWQQ